MFHFLPCFKPCYLPEDIFPFWLTAKINLHVKGEGKIKLSYWKAQIFYFICKNWYQQLFWVFHCILKVDYCAEKWIIFQCFAKNCLHWANMNFCYNSLLYPEAKWEQGGGTVFSEQPYPPFELSPTHCLTLAASLSCLPIPFRPLHLVSSPPLLPLHIQCCFDIISSYFLGKKKKKSPVFATFQLPAAFRILLVFSSDCSLFLDNSYSSFCAFCFSRVVLCPL